MLELFKVIIFPLNNTIVACDCDGEILPTDN